MVLDPRSTELDVCLELRDQRGIAGDLHLHIEFKEFSPEDVKNTVDTQYEQRDALDTIKSMMKDFQTQSVGQAKKAAGFLPKYPVLIVPGLASSALEAWESPKSAWIRERVWIDPFKIGKTAISMKLSSKMGRKTKKSKAVPTKKKSKFGIRSKSSKTKTEEKEESDTGEGEDEIVNERDNRIWLQHILLGPDGFSDPPGIKLRPCEGLAACDYLATNPLARKASYVMGYLIHELAMVGYTPNNFDAAPVSNRI